MFTADIKKLAKENTNFRKVLSTGVHSQLVVMSIPANSDIGEEVHADVDQILFFVDGDCKAIIDGEERIMKEHDIVFVPAKSVHNFINIGSNDVKLFTVYSPPEHADGTVHATKADAQHTKVAT